MDKYGKPYPFTMPLLKNRLPEHPEILVLSGGAIKGIYLLGALYGLNGKHENIVDTQKFSTYVGTSSGAIICFLLSIGYSPYDIFVSLLKSDNLLSINLDNLRLSSTQKDSNGMIEKKGGIFSTYHIYDHVKNQIRLKNLPASITFRQHFEKTGKKLVIMAFNLTQRREDIFEANTTPDMSILHALKLSACIPIIFEPLKYKNDFYVDGGIWNNFPVNIAVRYKNKNNSWILAMTTVHSLYERTVNRWYGIKNINFVMVEDTRMSLTLVSTDTEKFAMFVKGQQTGEKIIEKSYKKNRRNTV
jgi:predicted acylesterase/phospholipase RssA